ncbi:Z1 domain-containing protein [Promicromonospora sp. NPDC090134]|uniref:Z1 domain-containing protein n=1 Tax=Promicromonospora sp. NPDC090134 TaxID=3364408 RepID=UPI0037F2D582
MNAHDGAHHGVERVTLVREPGESDSWWTAYADRLAASGIGGTSREVIEADARYIVDHGIFGAGEPTASRWPATRERRGLVMGAVQSGKTASMLAVAAMALDRGVDALVILGGTRTTLWIQTFERFLGQLDTQPNATRRRLRIPAGEGSELDGSDLSLLYSLSDSGVKRALQRRRPIIAVAMKNTAHLERLGRNLRDVVYPLAMQRDEPFHLLVIDDEADDSSVVDASAEGLDEIDVRRKQIPRRIVDLWESRQQRGETVQANVYATYLAYTATPQANFLQDDTNPLAPTDFVASLRTPGPSGDPVVRESGYRIPDGIRGWYTGGEIYYKALADVPLCLPTDDADPASLVPDAVRGFLVAAAIRLNRSQGRVGPYSARGSRFRSWNEAKAIVIDPMSMLINPSSAKESHFDVADAVIAWAGGHTEDHCDGVNVGAQGRDLGTEGLVRDMDERRDAWVTWLDRYRSGTAKVDELLTLTDPRPVPEAWDVVRRLILEEIAPGTRVAVINSDERADDRPEFSPRRDANGVWCAPANISTIFVSGNVMSRGLTLEGLMTTLFTRSASTPLADTQMQMQRWFGYRGGYIDLCRVLMPRDQLNLFMDYHENDEALRRDVLRAMDSGTVPDLTILQGRTFRATGKIANLRAEPLFPGPRPFVRHMNPAGADGDNLGLVSNLFAGEVLAVPAGSAKRGLLLPDPLSLTDAAGLLERLRYVDHGPGSSGLEASRWQSVANHAQIPATDESLPLYRAPDVEGSRDLGSESPYAIAAYLRLWSAVVSRRVPGLTSTDEPSVRWSLIERDLLVRRQPRFWVGLRFGDGEAVVDGPLTNVAWPVRPMLRRVVEGTNDLDASWGSRNYSGDVIRGDDLFDLVARGIEPQVTPTGARLPGSDGLILFHVVDRFDGHQTIAAGVSVPLGGPDHIRARSGA